ncbi:MAG: cobaltochelatase subunit CobN [Thermodesulfobacteria bacterium]|nr:cobaltochelatase subunit CobN [Thermodesulfobacteriota bacterium]
MCLKSKVKILLILLLMELLFFSSRIQAKTFKVSLILGDASTKPLLLVLKDLKKNNQAFLKKIQVKFYPQKGILSQNLNFVADSDVIVINIMGKTLPRLLAPWLIKAKKKGAWILGVYSEGSYDKSMKKLGIKIDPKVEKYVSSGGIRNFKNLIFYIANKYLHLGCKYSPPVKIPDFAIYDWQTHQVFKTYKEFWKFKKPYIDKSLKKPWIGVVFYKYSYINSQMKPIDAVCKALYKAGFNVLAVWGYPSCKAIKRFLFDESGKSRVKLVVAFALKVGVNPETTGKVLKKLGVPVIDVICLYSESKKEWEESPKGLNLFERTWQVFNPELAGIIQPMVVASKEVKIDKKTGETYIDVEPIKERISMLVKRVKAWINLQEKPNSKKHIAIIYYDYPPGKQNIGASYLNVLPGSIWEILNALKEHGYDVGNLSSNATLGKKELLKRVISYGRNIAKWAPAELTYLVKHGHPVLIPIKTYEKWFKSLPEQFKKEVIKAWGPPESAKIMTWTDKKGRKYLVIPVVRYGNVVLTPQPSRAWEQDEKKMYHSVKLPPHHQYIAFYLWLKKIFKADAVIHLGTHGTHEWLPGKEIGFTAWDDPEVLIQDIPNIYPYIVDDVGEGLQAKRRGMAVVIDHLTPPEGKGSLNPDLLKVRNLIQAWQTAKEKSKSLAELKLKTLTKLVKKLGLLKDLNIKLKKGTLLTEAQIEKLQDYLQDIAETTVPYGLHIFGRSPSEKAIKKMAQSMIKLHTHLSLKKKKVLVKKYENELKVSGKLEMDALLSALKGKYVPSAPGNDPVLNPSAIPTGKDFYAFDPTKIPSPDVYEKGKKLAEDLLKKYLKKHHKYPEKVAFVLWAVETIRHEGVVESEIMYLLGVKPVWDASGKVVDLKLIPRSKLKRPRIDVVLNISGLYRDLFSNLVLLLDKAIKLANSAKEKDNFVRMHTLYYYKLLLKKGIKKDLALRIAKVRIFSEKPGTYGTGIGNPIVASNTWKSDKKIAKVYFLHTSYMFGEGFWGKKNEFMWKQNLKGVNIAVHSLSTNVYGVLDNDDFYQYLGGLTLAIRTVNGKNPEVYVTNLSNPFKPKQELLSKVMGREIRVRYLNPAWIKAMLKQGYEGARFVDQVVEYLWGWQVTYPSVVDSAKWYRFYQVYVKDEYHLHIKKYFEKAHNMWAYQSIIGRMLEAIRKGYWKPNKKVVQDLAKRYVKIANKIGLACCEHTCNNPLLSKFIVNTLMGIPGMKKSIEKYEKLWKNIHKVSGYVIEVEKTFKNKSAHRVNQKMGRAPGSKGVKKPIVKGYLMKEIKKKENSSPGSSNTFPYFYAIAFITALLVFLRGFKKKK